MFGRKGKKIQPEVLINLTVTNPSAGIAYVPPEDKRTDVCPNCSGKLAKIPAA